MKKQTKHQSPEAHRLRNLLRFGAPFAVKAILHKGGAHLLLLACLIVCGLLPGMPSHFQSAWAKNGPGLTPHEKNQALLEFLWLGRVDNAQEVLKQGATLDTLLLSPEDMLFHTLLIHILQDDLAAVKQDLEHGANLNAITLFTITPLMYATLIGNLEMVKLLVQQGAELNETNYLNLTALSEAVGANHLAIADYLITQGAAVNALDADHDSPLNIAAKAGHQKMVDFLIHRGADPHAVTGWFGSPLMAAAQGGHLELVRHFRQEYGAKLSVRARATPLMQAAASGNTELVAWLIAQGADLHETSTTSENALSQAAIYGHHKTFLFLKQKGANLPPSNPVLVKAARNGHLQMVRVLIEQGVDLRQMLMLSNKITLTAAMAAVENGHVEVFELLQAAGAPVDLKAALFKSSEAGHLELIQSLISQGIDPNTFDRYYGTPLIMALNYKRWDLVHYLLAQGARVNVKTDLGTTPLIKAAYGCSYTISKQLLQMGADPNAYSEWDSFPLDGAASCGSLAIMQMLLDHGAEIRTQPNTIYSPLQHAIQGGHVQVVDFLVQHGLRLSGLKDDKGSTPLIWALEVNDNRQSSLAMVKYLVQAKVNPTARNHQGQSALDIAVKRNQTESAAFLKTLAK